MRALPLRSALLIGPLFIAPLTVARLWAQESRPSGTWRLDLAKSDSFPARPGPRADSLRRPRAGLGGMGGEAGGRGGIEGGMGGRGRMGGGRRLGGTPSAKDLARMRQTYGLLRHPPRTIRFDPGDSTVTLGDDSGATTTWRTDGTKYLEKVEDAGDIETRIRWASDGLVIERKVDGGGRIRENYGLGLGGKRLIVFVQLDASGQEFSLTRQYQPDTSAGS